MKKILFIAAVTLFTGMSKATAQEGWAKYGEEFKMENVETMQSLTRLMAEKQEADVQLEGYISEVCQAMGCWMKLKNEAGEDVMIKMKDHAFFLPKDLAGKPAIVKGTVKRKTVPVEELRHYAEDAGASKAEIKKIKEPKVELQLVASGVMVKI